MGLLNTVGGHDDGPGKLGKFFGLILPGGAIVAIKMSMFFEFRISVAGQHFTMGIDIDALAVGLL